MHNFEESIVLVAELLVLLLFIETNKYTKDRWGIFRDDVNKKGNWEFIFDNFDFCIIYAANILIIFIGLGISLTGIDLSMPYSLASYVFAVLCMVLFAFLPVIATDLSRDLIFDRQKYIWSFFLMGHVILTALIIVILFLSSRVLGYSISMGLLLLLIIMFDEYFFYHLLRMFSMIVSEDNEWAIDAEG